MLASAGCQLTAHHGMIEDELVAAGVTTIVSATDAKVVAMSIAEGRFEAALFLMKSNQEKYGQLVQELAKTSIRDKIATQPLSLGHTR